PMLIGGVAFLLRWRSGPPLVLFVFLWMAPTRFQHALEPDTFMSAILNSAASLGQHIGRSMDLSASLEDVILCAALLTYTVACYRALSLSHSIFPPDSRRPRVPSKDQGRAVLAPPPAPLVPRPAQPVNSSELPLLLVALSGA